MKKAKEYADEYNQAENKREALAKVMLGMVADTDELCKTRKVNTNEALKAVILEVEQKYNAFVRRAEPTVEDNRIVAPAPDVFITFLKNAMPDIAKDIELLFLQDKLKEEK